MIACASARPSPEPRPSFATNSRFISHAAKSSGRIATQPTARRRVLAGQSGELGREVLIGEIDADVRLVGLEQARDIGEVIGGRRCDGMSFGQHFATVARKWIDATQV